LEANFFNQGGNMLRLVWTAAAATVVLLTLGFASGAWALPPQCEFSCTCNSRCSQVCAIGNWVTTCDFDQICRDYCFAATSTGLESTADAAASPATCDAEDDLRQPETPKVAEPGVPRVSLTP
jgi:hypothetical protein